MIARVQKYSQRIAVLVADLQEDDQPSVKSLLGEVKGLQRTLRRLLPAEPPPARDELHAWADRTWSELCLILASRKRWRLVSQAWKDNKIPQSIGRWIARMYVDTTVIAIRRQDDHSKESECLRRILGGVAELDLKLICDELELDPEQDGNRLCQVVERARDRANKLVAHLDEDGPKSKMTFRELDDAVDELIALANPYLDALRGLHVSEPREQVALDEVFLRRSWIAPKWEDHWRDGWLKRVAEHFPELDFLAKADHAGIRGEISSIASGLWAARSRCKTPVSPIRGQLEASGLASSDAAVQLVKDLLRERGVGWYDTV